MKNVEQVNTILVIAQGHAEIDEAGILLVLWSSQLVITSIYSSLLFISFPHN